MMAKMLITALLVTLTALHIADAASIDKITNDKNKNENDDNNNNRDKQQYLSTHWNDLANAFDSYETISSSHDEFDTSYSNNLNDSSEKRASLQTTNGIYEGPVPSSSFTDSSDELESQGSTFSSRNVAITRLQPTSNLFNFVQRRPSTNFQNQFSFQQRRNPIIISQQSPSFQQQLLQQQRNQQQFSRPISRPVQLQFRPNDDSTEDDVIFKSNLNTFRNAQNNRIIHQQRFTNPRRPSFSTDDDSREIILPRNNNPRFRHPATVQRVQLLQRTEIGPARLLPQQGNVRTVSGQIPSLQSQQIRGNQINFISNNVSPPQRTSQRFPSQVRTNQQFGQNQLQLSGRPLPQTQSNQLNNQISSNFRLQTSQQNQGFNQQTGVPLSILQGQQQSQGISQNNFAARQRLQNFRNQNSQIQQPNPLQQIGGGRPLSINSDGRPQSISSGRDQFFIRSSLERGSNEVFATPGGQVRNSNNINQQQPGFNLFSVDRDSHEFVSFERDNSPEFVSFERDNSPEFESFERDNSPEFVSFERDNSPEFVSFERDNSPEFVSFERNNSPEFESFEQPDSPEILSIERESPEILFSDEQNSFESDVTDEIF